MRRVCDLLPTSTVAGSLSGLLYDWLLQKAQKHSNGLGRLKTVIQSRVGPFTSVPMWMEGRGGFLIFNIFYEFAK
jgi:hypothetical protein